MTEVNERITTTDDGDTTVNERLSSGGKGPEGQPDTVTESLSGRQTQAPAEPPEIVEDEPEQKPTRRTQRS